MNEKNIQKMLELLADETLFGLDREESAELAELQKRHPEWANDKSFEITAAAINLAVVGSEKPLPAHLREKLLLKADEFFGEPKEDTHAQIVPQFTESAATQTVREVVSEPKPFGWNWLGWAFAALALVALGINVWTTRTKPRTEIVANQPVITTPTPEPSMEEKRRQLISSSNDIVQTEWKSPTDENKVLGDIVWSNSKQQGYVKFRDLPVNEADEKSYQLWISDAARNEKTPVSAGVFNVTKTGEIIIPIDVALKIKNPKQFALTREKSGGVMVSKLDDVVAVAKV